jgi:diguanylate cyclase (GGDEF)-like protein
MSGFEVLNTLKSFDNTRAIPIIFITNLPQTEDEEYELSLGGAADYIIKPFNNAAVRTRLKNQAQIIIQMRIIEKLGHIDALTNIPNRHSFDQRLKTEWFRAMRDRTPLSLLLVDVDELKNYNDAYGYAQGDLLLHALAQTMSRILQRPADFSARFGGDEFAVIMPNTDAPGALIIAERIRASVHSQEIPRANEAGVTSATVSIGAASIIPSPEYSIAEFIAKTSLALATAQKYGRNQVCS